MTGGRNHGLYPPSSRGFGAAGPAFAKKLRRGKLALGEEAEWANGRSPIGGKRKGMGIMSVQDVEPLQGEKS